MLALTGRAVIPRQLRDNEQNDAIAARVNARCEARESGRPMIVNQLPARDQAWASNVARSLLRITAKEAIPRSVRPHSVAYVNETSLLVDSSSITRTAASIATGPITTH